MQIRSQENKIPSLLYIKNDCRGREADFDRTIEVNLSDRKATLQIGMAPTKSVMERIGVHNLDIYCFTPINFVTGSFKRLF